jgi:hypothetical protein
MNQLDRFPGLVLAFHGCDKSVGEKILAGTSSIRFSRNNYDWLGHGAYFWEHDPERALIWAEKLKSMGKVKTPFVIGVALELGNCLNLVRSRHLQLLQSSYANLFASTKSAGAEMPRNKSVVKGGDLLIRTLDCAVIEFLHLTNKESRNLEFDTVRGVFFEDKELYENAGFKVGNHIQICVRNLNMIKGYFRVAKEMPASKQWVFEVD